MIDIHCHILPGIDDGARSLEESEAMADMLVQEGVTTVVATPHMFDLRYPTPTTSQLNGLLRQVKAATEGRLQIVSGAEVRVVPEMLNALDRAEMFINGGPFLLIEFPGGIIPHGSEHLVFKLMSSGIRPIIAHPERNRGFLADPGRLGTFVRMGCYGQLTATCVQGREEARHVAWRWIEAGLIHFVASDSHQSGWRRPCLAEPYQEVEKQFGPAVAKALFVENPRAAVNGEPLPHTPEVRPVNNAKTAWWQGWWRAWSRKAL